MTKVYKGWACSRYGNCGVRRLSRYTTEPGANSRELASGYVDDPIMADFKQL